MRAVALLGDDLENRAVCGVGVGVRGDGPAPVARALRRELAWSTRRARAAAELGPRVPLPAVPALQDQRAAGEHDVVAVGVLAARRPSSRTSRCLPREMVLVPDGDMVSVGVALTHTEKVRCSVLPASSVALTTRLFLPSLYVSNVKLEPSTSSVAPYRRCSASSRRPTPPSVPHACTTALFA